MKGADGFQGERNEGKDAKEDNDEEGVCIGDHGQAEYTPYSANCKLPVTGKPLLLTGFGQTNFTPCCNQRQAGHRPP